MPDQTRSALLSQLGENSTPYRDPLALIDWSKLDRDAFWLPEPAVSLYGLSAYDTLSLEQRIRLSQLEFLHLTEVGIWLENLFIYRISRAGLLHQHALHQSAYDLHQMREEAGHSLMFRSLQQHAGYPSLCLRMKRPRQLSMLARWAPISTLAYQAAHYLGEALPDRINRNFLRIDGPICPVITQITQIHIRDEARHIASSLNQLTTRISATSAPLLQLSSPLLGLLTRQFIRRLFFPDAIRYECAGLENGKLWRRHALNNPVRMEFVEQCVSSVFQGLSDQGLVLNWPLRRC